MSAVLACAGDRRSALLADTGHPLDGIDFVEYRRRPEAPAGRQYELDVTLLKPLAGELPQARIEGGVRIVGLRVLAVEVGEPGRLSVFLSGEGDFSLYLLVLDHPDLDPERAEARFSFKASCPSELDCAPLNACVEPSPEEPALDYLAKDYQSFRRLLVDLVALRNPDWTERLPADLGMTLLELIAYAGDALSYAQDAAATEAWLDTCRHRLSAARHARLIDYAMHDGRAAWTWAHLVAAPGTDAILPMGSALATRVSRALIGHDVPPGVVLPDDADFDHDPALADALVFETSMPVRVSARHNQLFIHDWGDARCSLPAGATEAWLYAVEDREAVAPALAAGDWLLIEEVVSPSTGIAADADPAQRHVMQLVAAADAEDGVFAATLDADGRLVPRHSLDATALPLRRVRWTHGLSRCVTLSAEDDRGRTIAPVAVARGNVVPTDHGRTRLLDSAADEIGLPVEGLERWPLPTLALPPDLPVTRTPIAADALYDGTGQLLTPRAVLAGDAPDCVPALTVLLDEPGGVELWRTVPHLLDSGPFDRHLVVETDDFGATRLRFGDGEHGRRPTGVTRARACVRSGGGRRGNLGAEALVHVVGSAAAAIVAVRQPLPARDGTDPETVASVRALAPEAFRAIQRRAVTEEDWRTAALRHPAVAAARVTFRWTGSWHTAFVAIHPVDPGALTRLPGGAAALVEAVETAIAAHLGAYRLAGRDVAVRAAAYAPIEIDVQLCVSPGHRRGAVLAAARAALTGPGGPFDRLASGFGEAVYLSRIYAALAGVPGVDSATVTRFKRLRTPASDELERGRIPIAPHEIARLADDPDEPEGGTLRLTAVAGL